MVDRSDASGVVRVGCSGWVYPDWRGVVYPRDAPQRRWFELYAERFDTVEINSTFYRLPSPDQVDRWREQAPPGFRYACKVGQYVTHRKKLADVDTWLPNHLDRVDRLDVDRLEAFLTVAPRHIRWAVEVRDPTWLHDDVYDALARHGAALCVHDLLPDHPWIRTADWTYVRFHGPRAIEQPYHGRYTGRRLWRVADRLGALLDEGVDVYAYFNNDIGGASVADATWLRDRLTGERPA